MPSPFTYSQSDGTASQPDAVRYPRERLTEVDTVESVFLHEMLYFFGKLLPILICRDHVAHVLTTIPSADRKE